MTKKYLLKEQIPNTDYKVGHVFEENSKDVFNIKVRSGQFMPIHSLEAFIMCKLNILEEVKEETQDNNKNTLCLKEHQNKAQCIMQDCPMLDDKYILGFKNGLKEAQQALDKIMKGELLESK